MGLLANLMTQGVRPINGDRPALAEAIREHSANGDPYQIGNDVTFRDEIEPEVGTSVEQLAIHTYRQAIFDSQIPSYGWTSWLDAGTAEAALRRFLTYPGADHVTIGAWNHSGMLQASPYLAEREPISPPAEIQFRELLRFLDTYLLDMDTGIRGERKITYYTLGSETWQTCSTWPPVGVEIQRWYFNADYGLSRNPSYTGWRRLLCRQFPGQHWTAQPLVGTRPDDQ